MKRFITTFKNIFSIEELRTRIFTTIMFLVMFRLGSFVVLPGVDPSKLDEGGNSEGILGVINTFSGGAFNNVSVFGLGIMPYISASIVLQLLTFAVPYFQRLQKDGESGRKKINQYTRILTIVITVFQSIAYLAATLDKDMIYEGMDSQFMNVVRIITLISGTMFCMWIGERITEKGIGNGISMLIMIGIVSRLPFALMAEVRSKNLEGALPLLIEFAALFFVIMLVVLVQQATRRIPIQYTKQIAGGKQVVGQRQYLPLKLIAAGVMPIIFAQSVMFLPAIIGSSFADTNDFANSVAATFNDPTSWQYNLSFATMIILFTYFYTAITVNPNSIAEDLRRNGGFIPSVKPGAATSEYIDDVLTKITLPGSLFLAVLAILPAFASMSGIEKEFSYFYGGTSLLIMIGVVLDTLQQIESFLLMKHYDGMMQTGRVKGRLDTAAV
ncbi:MAG: preprotein translocase subunit SecY [Cytophaga sp.]|uniref:preprotein translocase subunit SecY n=1 Tax=Cytophaga sp. TaxID=29535 RepID=UPI003F81771F